MKQFSLKTSFLSDTNTDITCQKTCIIIRDKGDKNHAHHTLKPTKMDQKLTKCVLKNTQNRTAIAQHLADRNDMFSWISTKSEVRYTN